VAEIEAKGERHPVSKSTIHLINCYNDARVDSETFSELCNKLMSINDQYSLVKFKIKRHDSPAQFRIAVKAHTVNSHDVIVLVGMCIPSFESFTSGCEDVMALEKPKQYFIAIKDSKHTDERKYPVKTLILSINDNKYRAEMSDYYNDYVYDDDHLGHKNALYRVAPPINPVLRRTDFVWNVTQIREAFRWVTNDLSK